MIDLRNHVRSSAQLLRSRLRDPYRWEQETRDSRMIFSKKLTPHNREYKINYSYHRQKLISLTLKEVLKVEKKKWVR